MLFIQFNVFDSDLGFSGNVIFFFSGYIFDRVRNFFSLYFIIGKFIFQGFLDFESENYYEFDVRVRDGGFLVME